MPFSRRNQHLRQPTFLMMDQVRKNDLPMPDQLNFTFDRWSEFSTALRKVITDVSVNASQTASLSVGWHLKFKGATFNMKICSISNPSRFASCLEWEQQRKPTVAVRGGLANLNSFFLICLRFGQPEKQSQCCGEHPAGRRFLELLRT